MSRMTKIMLMVCSTLMITMLFGMSAKAYSYPTLYQGSRGNDVRILQELLNEVYGTRLATDGVYGLGTRMAVRSFQSRYRLGLDGIAGPKTWAKLYELQAEKYVGRTTKKLYYGGNAFYVPKGYDKSFVYTQTTTKNCTSTASDIGVSVARGVKYRNTGWNGGCTWRDRSGASIHWVGYDKTSAQVKLNKTAEIVTKGYPVIIRYGTDYPGHSVCVIGVRKGCNMMNVTYSDLLVADPADGAVRLMSETKSKKWWHGGVVSYNGTETTRWALVVPKEAPQNIMQGFHIR